MWQVVGHDHVVAYLEKSLKKNALSHAYLFTGPKHIGKTTVAIALAQAVNCQNKNKPCGDCSSCLRIAAEAHPDVQVIRRLSADAAEDGKAKSELVIEQIRSIQRSASLPPYEGLSRVYIFEQAELLNEAAANCLLKTLEEPHQNVLLILLAPSLGAVPETIASRCQHLAFRRVPAGGIEGLLIKRGQPPDQAAFLASLSGGAPGWALMAIDNEEVLSRKTERIEKLYELINQDYEERFAIAEELAGKGPQGRDETAEIIEDWQYLWRDLLLLKAGCATAIEGLGADRVGALSQHLSISDIRDFLEKLVRARELIERNVNPRLIIETLMLEMPLLDKTRLKG